MRRAILTAAAAAFTFFAAPTAFAQDDGPAFVPLEMWACKYKDRKDQSDMDDIYRDEAEANEGSGYSAWHLNPYMVGDRVEQFDFLYLGAWNSGSTMGSGLTEYFANNAELSDAWDETVDCMGSLYASNTIQPVPESDSGGNFVLTVSDCKVGHGSTAAQAMGALGRFNEYRKANGSTVPTFAWFPVYGGGAAEFDFKLVHGYADIQAVGDGFSWYVDNQAYNTMNALTAGIVECDEARAYLGRTLISGMN